MTLRELMQDKAFMTKVVWLGYIASMVLMAVGLFFIIRELI